MPVGPTAIPHINQSTIYLCSLAYSIYILLGGHQAFRLHEEPFLEMDLAAGSLTLERI